MLAFFKPLGVGGIIGGIVSIALGTLLIVQKVETRHWKKQAGQFEQLYHGEQVAFIGTVANYHAALTQARADDAANKARVLAEQTTINQEASHDYEARIADARAAAQRLRDQLAAATHPGSSGAAPVPGVRAPAGGIAQAACDRLPGGTLVDWKLCATEQAIQLDELIKAVKKQAGVDVNRPPAAVTH